MTEGYGYTVSAAPGVTANFGIGGGTLTFAPTVTSLQLAIATKQSQVGPGLPERKGVGIAVLQGGDYQERNCLNS